MVRSSLTMATFDCLVPSWSDVGARLILLSTVGIPDRFVLNIKYIGRRSPVRVVWRNEVSLGVEFDGSYDTASSAEGD